MKNTEAIKWLKAIKEKYIHGGDEWHDSKRKEAIDCAITVLGGEVKTNADRIRAMSDEELAEILCVDVCGCPSRDCRPTCELCIKEWLEQPAEEEIADG